MVRNNLTIRLPTLPTNGGLPDQPASDLIAIQLAPRTDERAGYQKVDRSIVQMLIDIFKAITGGNPTNHYHNLMDKVLSSDPKTSEKAYDELKVAYPQVGQRLEKTYSPERGKLEISFNDPDTKQKYVIVAHEHKNVASGEVYGNPTVKALSKLVFNLAEPPLARFGAIQHHFSKANLAEAEFHFNRVANESNYSSMVQLRYLADDKYKCHYECKLFHQKFSCLEYAGGSPEQLKRRQALEAAANPSSQLNASARRELAKKVDAAPVSEDASDLYGLVKSYTDISCSTAPSTPGFDDLEPGTGLDTSGASFEFIDDELTPEEKRDNDLLSSRWHHLGGMNPAFLDRSSISSRYSIFHTPRESMARSSFVTANGDADVFEDYALFQNPVITQTIQDDQNLSFHTAYESFGDADQPEITDAEAQRAQLPEEPGLEKLKANCKLEGHETDQRTVNYNAKPVAVCMTIAAAGLVRAHVIKQPPADIPEGEYDAVQFATEISTEINNVVKKQLESHLETVADIKHHGGKDYVILQAAKAVAFHSFKSEDNKLAEIIHTRFPAYRGGAINVFNPIGDRIGGIVDDKFLSFKVILKKPGADEDSKDDALLLQFGILINNKGTYCIDVKDTVIKDGKFSKYLTFNDVR